MLKKDIRKYIIKPTLQIANMWSESAETLVYGTGIVETNYDYLMQIGTPENGGVGFFQGQPSDTKDIGKWLANGFNKGMLQRVLSCCYYDAFPSDPMVLAHNIRFAVLICRIHYWRIKEKLPAPDDALGMAKYHKKYYNGGALGKADVEKNTIAFQKVIDGD